MKVYDKIHLSIQMITIYNVKHLYEICLRSEDKFLTSLTKLVLDANISICSPIKENLLFYYRKFSTFVVSSMYNCRHQHTKFRSQAILNLDLP